MHNLDKAANHFRDQLTETLAELVSEHAVIIEQVTIKPKVFQIVFIDMDEDRKIRYELPIIKYKEEESYPNG